MSFLKSLALAIVQFLLARQAARDVRTKDEGKQP